MTAPPASAYLLQGTTLALAWFFLVNAALTGMSAFALPVLTRRARPPAGFWFALRVLPGLGAAAFVAAMFVPSYWRYEPLETTEGFDVSLAICGAAAIAVLTAAGARAIGAWR